MIKHITPQTLNLILKDLGSGEVFIAHFTVDGKYTDIFRMIKPSSALKIWLEHDDRKFAMLGVDLPVMKNWECGFVDFYTTVDTVFEGCETSREAEIQKLLETIRKRFAEVASTADSSCCRWLSRPSAHHPGNEYLLVSVGRVMLFDQVKFDAYVKPYLEIEVLTSAEQLAWHIRLYHAASYASLSSAEYVAFNAHDSQVKPLVISDL